MAVYTWNGYSEKGRDVRGMMDASSLREAKLKLRAQGIFVHAISEESATEDNKRSWNVSLGKIASRPKMEDVTVMTRQLSTLVGASIPLVEALHALYEQTDNPGLKKTVAQVRDSVNEGESFADALGHHRRTFPDIYINMVRSGEISGALDVVLLRLAEFLEGQRRLRAKVGTAMMYPLFLFGVSMLVLFYLLIAIVPKVVGMFETMDQVLPLPTRILIGVSGFLGSTWWILLAGAVIAFWAARKWTMTEKGRLKFDRFRMQIPFYGSIYNKVSVARFSRTLGTLLSAGVPVIEALNIVKTVVLNRVMEDAIDNTVEQVMDGSTVAEPLKRSGVFPPIIIHMINVGERSGSLEDMLLKASNAYEEEVETAVAGLTSILEPLMIVIMGLCVGFVVMAILFPMLEMSQVVH
ncbi:MAG: type II secretion system inner membrane protein GspF [Thermodesulfobacteriota bacterium]|nr:type II secretion system inner membrane protein GspF [Thermodesulfobacteriota bacterium]